MKQHEGIIVIAYLIGQPRSETVAALCRADLEDQFVTDVVADYEEGVAAKVNTIDEAEELCDELTDANISAMIHYSTSGEPPIWHLA